MELLKSSFALFKERFWKLMILQVVPLVVVAIAGVGMGFSVALGGASGWMLLLLPIFVFLMGVAASMAILAMIDVFQQDTPVKMALKQSFNKVWGYLWVVFLMGLIVAGGYILLFIPGIILSVWFSFAIYVFALEGKRGMDALMTSKEYVRGYWWAVFGRFLSVALVALAVFMPVLILSAIFGEEFGGFVSSIVQFVFMPFMMAYIYTLYKHLQETKPTVASQEAPKEGRGWFIALAVVPVIALFVALAFGGLFLLKFSTMQFDEDFYMQGDFNQEIFEGIDFEELENLGIQ